MRVKAALAVGLALIALAFVLTLTHAPLSVARRGVATEHTLVNTGRPAPACQSGETLPRGTTALRLSLAAALGPRVAVKVFSGPHVVAHGMTPPGWSNASVTVAVAPLPRTLAPVKVCFAMTEMNGRVAMRGSPTSHALAATSENEPLPGRMGIEYLHPSGNTWWSQATSVARRLGLGRTAGGTWTALLVMALVMACIALTSWLVVQELQ